MPLPICNLRFTHAALMRPLVLAERLRPLCAAAVLAIAAADIFRPVILMRALIRDSGFQSRRVDTANPAQIRLICESVIPNRGASTQRAIPATRAALISIRCSSDTFERPFFSPLNSLGYFRMPFASPRAFKWRGHIGGLSRPLSRQSLTLSICVPKNRWSGLQHAGTSHRWRTWTPIGIGPRQRLHATRWALCVRPSHRTSPYRCRQPCQIQHP